MFLPTEAGESRRDIRRSIELDYKTPLENQECFQHEDAQGDKAKDTEGKKNHQSVILLFLQSFKEILSAIISWERGV